MLTSAGPGTSTCTTTSDPTMKDLSDTENVVEMSCKFFGSVPRLVEELLSSSPLRSGYVESRNEENALLAFPPSAWLLQITFAELEFVTAANIVPFWKYHERRRQTVTSVLDTHAFCPLYSRILTLSHRSAPGGQLNAPAAKKKCGTNVPVEKSVPEPDLESKSDEWQKEDPNENGGGGDPSEPTAADWNTERAGRSVRGGKRQTAVPSDNDEADLEPLAERTGGQDQDQGTVNSEDKDVLPVQ
ncbi:hypothetical protein BDV98DRAFT_607661, partial [Pterulicium gracile]